MLQTEANTNRLAYMFRAIRFSQRQFFRQKMLAVFTPALLFGGVGFAGAQTYRNVYDFGAFLGTDQRFASSPVAGMVFDKAGNMYGTCSAGGPNGSYTESTGGTVWEMTAAGVYIDLHDFNGKTTNSKGKPSRTGTSPTQE